MRLDAVWTVFVLLSSAASACGPGRGSGRRRSISKLTPLVFKQHVPNVSENTLGASGLPEGRITREDPRFKNLVPVYSEDIIFKDEEGTGADRFMTQRCMEKLNALAISVMNQWPGVKLRVIEGWEEEAIYHSDNLHYEGRAVDITTSDKDRSKYGLLARLAVEAGFDWVYYEARAYIHCSVKSETYGGGRTGGCFSGNSTVTVESGLTRRLSDVQVGERVLSYDTVTGQLAFSELLMFLDSDAQSRHQFIELTTVGGGWSLRVTPQHLVMRKRDLGGNRTTTDWEAVFAARLSPNDKLLVNENGVLVERRLESSRLVLDQGIFAPLTESGTVVVDGVVASCYAIIESQTIAHAAFSPVRLYKKAAHGLERAVSFITHPFTPSIPSNLTVPATATTAKSSQSHGIPWYPKLLYTLTHNLIPDSMAYK